MGQSYFVPGAVPRYVSLSDAHPGWKKRGEARFRSEARAPIIVPGCLAFHKTRVSAELLYSHG